MRVYCVSTSGILVALKQKKKEVRKYNIYVNKTLSSAHLIWFIKLNNFCVNAT